MDFKVGAILHSDCLSVRNDGGECGGMPHHRVPLGIERNTIVKATLAYANQTRDYRIFEDFAFYMMKEACKKRETNILIYQERSMLLIRQLFRCVLQLFHGQSSEVRKEESKHMSYMT